MSRCNKIDLTTKTTRQTNYNKSLSTHASHKKWTNTNQFCHSEVPLCTGSMTLEAAVVFPLVAGFLVFILFFFRVMQIQTDVQIALSYAGRKTAAVAAETDNAGILFGTAYGLWMANLQNKDRIESYVDGGVVGINFADSDVSSDVMELVAAYRIRLPIAFFLVDSIPVVQHQQCKKWTGDSGGDSAEEEDDPYVYVTETGTVYHSSTACNYLDLSITSVNYAQIGGLRNRSEQIYHACEACAEYFSGRGEVYITNYGNRFHTTLGCMGLKRTIHMVHLSEVGGKGGCAKCVH